MRKDNLFFYGQVILILIFSFGPLFIDFPYRIHVFLTWEGSYRISSGEIPFKDFGMPIGVGFWILPSIFMKLFGPKFYSLVIAQSFINLVFLFSIREIFKRLGLNESKLLLLILIFCLSYVIKNFWPWYNNTVIFYEVLAFLFVLMYAQSNKLNRLLYGFLAGFFAVLSIFTKQDIGATGFLIVLVLFLYSSISIKDWTGLAIFTLAISITFIGNILPFIPYDFGYWFNYGQSPHYSRLNLYDFFTDILGASLWIKFYLIVVSFIVIMMIKKDFKRIYDKEFLILSLLSIMVVGQTLFIQVTSYHPPSLTWYFHGFAWAFLLRYIPDELNLSNYFNFSLAFVFICFWWSIFVWEYGSPYFKPVLSKFGSPENVVSKYTRFTEGEEHANVFAEKKGKVLSSLRTLYKIKIPYNTEQSLKEIIAELKPIGKDLHVLNFSELTFLEEEIGYKPLKGMDHPLWNHVGVSFFDREFRKFTKEIESNEFDMILFQINDYVKDFFPNDIHDVIKKNEQYKLYKHLDEPKGNSTGGIYIYLRSDILNKVVKNSEQ